MTTGDSDTYLNHNILTVDAGTGELSAQYDGIIATISGDLYGGAIAVSRIISGKRYMHLVGSGPAQYNIKKIVLAAPSPAHPNGIESVAGSLGRNLGFPPREADYSPDGTKLAWANIFQTIENVVLVNVVGLTPAGEHDTSAHANLSIALPVSHYDSLSLPGIEFDAGSNLLFIGTGSTQSSTDGIYVKDLSSGFNPSKVSGSQSYGASQLELAYNGYIYAGSSSGIKGIDPATNSFVATSGISITAPVWNGSYLLPDQLDGADYTPILQPHTVYNYSSFTAPHQAVATGGRAEVWVPDNNPVYLTTSHHDQVLRIKDTLRFPALPGGYYAYLLQDLHFEFGPGAVVIVEDSIGVELFNTTFTGMSNCNTMWQGVQAAGTFVSLSTPVPAPGAPDSAYRCAIHDAYAAITMSGAHAQLNVGGTDFNGNVKHIVLADCFPVSGSPEKRISDSRLRHTLPLKCTDCGIINPVDSLRYGKAGIDAYNSWGAPVTDAVVINNNTFEGGVYGITLRKVSAAATGNTFTNLHLNNGVAINANMEKSYNKITLQQDTFMNVYRGVVGFNGLSMFKATQNAFTGLLSNAIEISQNKDCEITITDNQFMQFNQNAVLLNTNAGTQLAFGGLNDSRITITNNYFSNQNQVSTATGIAINELGQTTYSTYRFLTIKNNVMNNLALGVITYNVKGNQNKFGAFNPAKSIGIGNDIYNNSIQFYATYTPTQKLTDYNTGIELNNSAGLNAVDNTIVSNQNKVWRNMAINSNNTTRTLFRGNTVSAGRGISARLNGTDNNYYCNTFNYTVNGISLGDHNMRTAGDVHGVAGTETRDNVFNGTFPNGSDIELYLDWASVSAAQLRSDMNTNQWLFARKPFVLITPDPNLLLHRSPVKLHRDYLNAGTAPDRCALSGGEPTDPPGGDESTSIPLPPDSTETDSLSIDTITLWTWEHDFEQQVKKEGRMRNAFMSQLIDLEELFATMEYEQAGDLLGEIETDHPYGINYLSVYQTLLDARYPEIRPLTEEEIETLTAIASQTPQQAGPVVYTARGILWCEVGLRFHDAEEDPKQGLGGQIVFEGCYETLPEDLTVTLVDEESTVYSEVPVMLDENGKIYVTEHEARHLDRNHQYQFLLNYPNTNPGLMSIGIWRQAESNDYVLCEMGKKENETKKTTAESPAADALRVYPNPADAMLNIDLPGNGPYRIMLYSLTGQVAYSNRANESFKVNTADFIPGMYFIKITGEKGEAVKTDKIIIQR